MRTQLPPDHQTDPDALPFNPLPPAVTLLAAAIFLVELAFQLGEMGLAGGPDAVGWRLALARQFGFSDFVFQRMVGLGEVDAMGLARFFTYPFIHASFMSMILALAFILALGKMVGETFSNWAVLVIFFGASIGGALAYGLFAETNVALLGSFPAAYGLIGAYTFCLWAGIGPRQVGKLQAFSLIAVLMGLQLLFGLLFGGSPEWIARLGGFVIGFLLSFVVSPGGWQALLAKLRQRG